MQDMYVVVVYENSTVVYNAATGDKLEERGQLDKQFKYRQACVNFKGNDLYLVAQNNSSGKNMVLSEIHQMMEIPPEKQIEFLLSIGRIKEANIIFLQKAEKGANF